MLRVFSAGMCTAAVYFSICTVFAQSGPPLPPSPPGFPGWVEETNEFGGATTSSFPDPPGEGGGGETTNSVPPAYSLEGLNLRIPLVLTNDQLYFYLFDNSTNGNSFTNYNYDIYGRSKFNFHYRWRELARGTVGQTNFYLPNPSPSNMFYVALLGTDSDNDGLTDGFESLITKTLNSTNDSDGDGITDFNEWRIGSNPTNSAGIVPDTNGVVNLRVHTRLK